jgi:chromosome segregation protein
LNGKTCRLRDIQDLFAGTGLSGAHYALIEQGRIGQILSAKPSDRRNLIEEAAGISKFARASAPPKHDSNPRKRI